MVFMCDFKVKPNLFIVGAAKAATTSIFNYLKQHPDVFFCEPKEPKYLSRKYRDIPQKGPGDDHIERKKSHIKNIDDYLRLFSEGAHKKYRGEASVDMLYYADIAYDIKKDYSDSKVIIILRNPVERAFSAYKHHVRDGREKYGFKKALALEEQRIKSNYSFLWHYKKVGLYSGQVKTYINALGKDNVFIGIYEDMIKSPEQFMARVNSFLKIKEIDYSVAEIYNSSGMPKSRVLHNLFVDRSGLKNILKIFITQDVRAAMKKKCIEINTCWDESMNVECKEILELYYSEDINKLEKVIGQSLDVWRDG